MYYQYCDSDLEYGNKLWDITSGKVRVDAPLKIRIKGRKKVDCLYGFPTFAINNKVLQHLRDVNCTGWSTFAVQVTEPATFKEELTGLIFNGKAGPLTGEEPVRFDLKTWDGSDFFTLEGTHCTMVSEKVYDLLSNYEVTGARFSPFIGE